MTKKNLYITTAIPYVNGTPHIGNALGYLLADIWARYEKQLDRTVRFQIGTDEHGNKIAQKAEKEGMEPREYADKMYGNFEQLAKKLNASYTDFVRTTDEHHEKAIQHIWTQLKPYIYKGSYEGWYCQGCECFVTDKEATENNGVCPDHDQPYQRLSEDNYYFKMSAFADRLKEAIESGKFEIVPEFRKHEILNLINSGLEDVSVSRPKKHLSWGVPVPDDPEQVIYVWIDALPNYITVLGYPDDETWREYWPADVQVIGKDILRFHAAIWPTMLMALDISLPKKLLVHGFVNVGSKKMSKTVGNVVDPNDIIDKYGLDAFRYYFSRHIPTQDDGDFTWEKFENAYNHELGNELGNLVQRVASMINRYQGGVIGDVLQPEHDIQFYQEAMRSMQFDRAIDEAWRQVRALNGYLESVKPWEVAKTRETDKDAEAHLAEILAYAAGNLVQIAILLAPFIPDTADAIQKIFGRGMVHPYKGVLFPKIYNHTPDPNAGKTPVAEE